MNIIHEHKLPNCTLLYTKKKIDGKYCASIRGFKNNHTCKNLVIPEKINKLPVMEIKNDSFKYSDIETLSLPDSIVHIGKYAFQGSPCLKNIILPKNLRVIGESAFSECAFLSNVVFNEGLRLIKHEAFFRTSLINITLPDSLVEIGVHAFAGTDIESVVLSDNLKTLGYAAFDDCPSLTHIYLGEILSGLDTTDDFAYGCLSLKNITVSKQNQELISIDGVLYNYKEKALLRVPPATNLNTIIIPKWVEKVAPHCFENINNKKIIIRQSSLKGLDECPIESTNTIECVAGSLIDEWAKDEWLHVVPIQSQINNFLADISESQTNVVKE